MKPEIESLQRQIDHYRSMRDHCTDILKTLNGYTPENFTFTFSIKDKPVIAIPITEDAGNFCVGVFMSWHQYYSRKLKEATTILNSPPYKVAV